MNDKEKEIDYKTGYGCVTIALSLIAIICSLAALSTVDINKDLEASESITITVLGTIVTLLVAWQIWITISSRDEVKKATESIDEINTLKADLETTKSLFTQRNLEIMLLIDAHAKLQDPDYYEELSTKYLRYADALEKLIQSNVDFSYDKFDDAFDGLSNVLLELNTTIDPVEVLGFIEEEYQYNCKYDNILTTLAKREKDIDDFRKRLAEAKRLRLTAIRLVKESEMGKKIEVVKKESEASKREAMERLRKEAETKATMQAENNTNAETLAQEAASAAREEAEAREDKVTNN